MVYKQKVLGLLEALQGKIRIIENVSNGAMNMDANQIRQVIEQSKKLNEQLIELVSIERE
jgi:hypothetical protein